MSQRNEECNSAEKSYKPQSSFCALVNFIFDFLEWYPFFPEVDLVVSGSIICFLLNTLF